MKQIPKGYKPIAGMDINPNLKGKITDLVAEVELENGEKIYAYIYHDITKDNPLIGKKVIVESNFLSEISDVKMIDETTESQ